VNCSFLVVFTDQWSLLAVGLPMIVLAIIAPGVEGHLKNVEDEKRVKNKAMKKAEEEEKLQRLVAMVIHAANHPLVIRAANHPVVIHAANHPVVHD